MVFIIKFIMFVLWFYKHCNIFLPFDINVKVTQLKNGIKGQLQYIPLFRYCRLLRRSKYFVDLLISQHHSHIEQKKLRKR